MPGSGDQQAQFLGDLRALVEDCFNGIRRQDPPSAWEARLARIAELSQRLEGLERHNGGQSNGPPG